jgi:hypothetical protein
MPDRVQVDPALWRKLLAELPGGGVDSSWSAPNDRLARFCREAGLPVADLLPTLRAAGDPGELYYALDHHWTVAGNRIAAATLAHIVRAWVAPQEPRS